MKKYGGLFKFLRGLTVEEGYLITKKLDDCNKDSHPEFTADLIDGSKKFMKMKKILMGYRLEMIKKGINHIIHRLI